MGHSKLFIYLFICLFVCCKAKNKIQSSSDKNEINFKKDSILSITEEKDTVVNDQAELEYLLEKMFVNNKYYSEGKINVLKPFIKKADSINKQGYECGYILEDHHEIWYYLNCEIEVSNTNYAFRKIDFYLSDFIVKYKDIVFSKNYTLTDFKLDFPLSFLKNKSEEKNGMMAINMLIHPLSDDIYIFKFKKNKLVELHYFSPC